MDSIASRGRLRRVAHNLKQGLSLAWDASPESLVRYSLLGVINAAMPPISVYLGATLVNRIADNVDQKLLGLKRGWRRFRFRSSSPSCSGSGG